MTEAPSPLVAHVFPTFAVGGAQVRFAALANHFGPRFRHLVVSLDGDTGCRERLDPALDVTFPAVEAPKNAMLANAWRFRGLLRRWRPDVLVTGNWGAIEFAMANLPAVTRHLHVVDGFGPEERETQIPRRILIHRLVLDRLALGRARVVVPSRTLERIATDVWKLSPGVVRYVPNGIDLDRFSPGAFPPGARVPGPPPVIGTVAALRAEKNLGRLIRAFALATKTQPARLVIVGDGPERAGLTALAADLGVADAVTFAGHRTDTPALYAGFDVFAPDLGHRADAALADRGDGQRPARGRDRRGRRARDAVVGERPPRRPLRRRRHRRTPDDPSGRPRNPPPTGLGQPRAGGTRLRPSRHVRRVAPPVGRGGVTEITVSRAPDLADLERRWRDLEQRASPSFFQSWTWTGCLAAERFPKPLLVEARENGRTVALALFNRRRGTLYLGENGDPRLDAIYIEHNGVLAETGRENELSGPCLRAARQATLGPRRRLMLAGIDERTIASAHETGDAQCYRTQQAPYLFLKNIDGDFLDGRSANTRQQMRRSDRHYAALGPLTLERADTVPRAHEFLFGLKGLHQATWTARGRPGAFAQGFFEQFHRALIGRGLPRGGDQSAAGVGGGACRWISLQFSLSRPGVHLSERFRLRRRRASRQTRIDVPPPSDPPRA